MNKELVISVVDAMIESMVRDARARHADGNELFKALTDMRNDETLSIEETYDAIEDEFYNSMMREPEKGATDGNRN